MCEVTDLKATYISPGQLKDYLYFIFPTCEYHKITQDSDFDALGQIDNVTTFGILFFEGDGINGRHAVRYVGRSQHSDVYEVIDSTSPNGTDTCDLNKILSANTEGIYLAVMSKTVLIK